MIKINSFYYFFFKIFSKRNGATVRDRLTEDNDIGLVKNDDEVNIVLQQEGGQRARPG